MSLISRIKNLFDSNSLPPQKVEMSQDKVEANQPAILPDAHKQEMPIEATGNGKQVADWKIGDNILDTFTVLDIKTGGMGRVYIAEHQHRKQKVAIKSPNENMLAEKTLFARVVREAQQWIDLGLHPHIAYCYYVRQINAIPHIFIEYVDGGNLRDWIRAERFKELKVGMDVAIQFCHGMEYAQQFGMVHRDIKPENVLMTANGTLKITDFGLARMTGGAEETDASAGIGISKKQEQLTMIGQKGVGTAAYMAPEQYLDLRSVDTRADIYSFGVCLYEMFCGCRPFEYESREVPPSILAKYQGHKPADPRTRRPDIPEKLAALLERCCALDKDDRYQSFFALRQDLVAIYRDLFQSDSPHAEIKLTSLKADGLNNRGASYWDLRREEDARLCWEEALKADPQHLAATFNLGYMQWHKAELGAGDFLARLRNLESAQGTEKDYWRCLAWTLYEQGYVDEIEELQKSPNAIKDEEFLRALEDEDRPIGRKIRSFEGLAGLESVEDICFSPDGRFVLESGTSSDNNREHIVRLWEVNSGRELVRYIGHTSYISAVTFSPDGSQVLTGSWDKTARLWETRSGLEIRRFEDKTKAITSVCFSPCGRYVLTGSGFALSNDSYDLNNTARLWDAKSGQEIRKFEGHSHAIVSICFSPDGQYVLTGSYDNTARLWDVASAREVRIFEGHIAQVFSATFSPNGQYALTGGFDDTACLWETASGLEVRCFWNTESSCIAKISHDGRYVLTGTHTVRLWDVDRGLELRRFDGKPGGKSCLSSVGNHILVRDADETAQLWEYSHRWQRTTRTLFPLLSRLQESARLEQNHKNANKLLQTAEDDFIRKCWHSVNHHVKMARAVPGFERSEIALELITRSGIQGKGLRYHLRDAWKMPRLEGHSWSIVSAKFSPDGKYVLTGSWDNTIRLWNALNGREVRQFDGCAGTITSVNFSVDGRYVLTGNGFDESGFAELFETESGLVVGFVGDTNYITSATLSPDGQYVLTGSCDKTAVLWETENGEVIRKFEGHTDTVNSVCFSGDGQYVLTGSDDNSARLWETKEGKEIRKFEGHTNRVNSVCFSPDGRLVLTSSDDKTARIWETANGQEVQRFAAHTDQVNCASFSPDGRYVLTGSGCIENAIDKTARLWETFSGLEVWRFDWHKESVRSVDFSPDGRRVLIGCDDGLVWLWELDWEWEFPGEGMD